MISFGVQLQTIAIHAQIIKTPSYRLETGSSVALGDQTPFWLMSNQYGLLTPNKFNFWLKAGIHSGIDSAKKIDYSYGIDLVNRFNSTYDIYLHQGYFQAKFWFTSIQIGKREETFGNQDAELSSGGMLWSGNARPMPKITLSVPKYTPIPFTWEFVKFKGGISHGWFDNNEYTKNVRLHHKYIYFEAGGKLPVHVHYGFHHFAQWGGTSSDTAIGKLPSGLKDFYKVFLVKSGAGSTATPQEEATNQLGNHIGSENFGIDIQLKKYSISFYWQTIFEDNSGFRHHNIEDGLWGILLKSNEQNKLINKILIEYIHTTDQSGPSQIGIDTAGNQAFLIGNDNYFNHFIYRQGWSYQRMTIGNPLITSPIIAHGDGNQAMFFTNNKITGIHLGLSGKVSNLNYKLFYTSTNNFGTNDRGFTPSKRQNSLYTHVSLVNFTKHKFEVGIAFGIDYGSLYGNNSGIFITLVKKGLLY